jgi:hypothetical protein
VRIRSVSEMPPHITCSLVTQVLASRGVCVYVSRSPTRGTTPWGITVPWAHIHPETCRQNPVLCTRVFAPRSEPQSEQPPPLQLRARKQGLGSRPAPASRGTLGWLHCGIPGEPALALTGFQLCSAGSTGRVFCFAFRPGNGSPGPTLYLPCPHPPTPGTTPPHPVQQQTCRQVSPGRVCTTCRMPVCI